MSGDEPQRIRLSQLAFLDNPPAGMDPIVVLAEIGQFARQLRKTAYPCDPPVGLSPIGNTGLYRVEDGRHRVIAAYIAGRMDIEYVLKAPDPEPRGA
jgi:hypothetical protein